MQTRAKPSCFLWWWLCCVVYTHCLRPASHTCSTHTTMQCDTYFALRESLTWFWGPDQSSGTHTHTHTRQESYYRAATLSSWPHTHKHTHTLRCGWLKQQQKEGEFLKAARLISQLMLLSLPSTLAVYYSQQCEEASDWLVTAPCSYSFLKLSPLWKESLYFSQAVICGFAPFSIMYSVKEQNHKQMMTCTQSHRWPMKWLAGQNQPMIGSHRRLVLTSK